ncbi:hypothetical protein GGTG_02868 [Gaeumannomyces tritici R3-111a-1]|uniref:N-acetyltransferase domain-containing protein n=1 Tax=Gaeumannomyces tritici (strain R3-111a-1) TaxID=644352 RepID=J3NNL1_GAET3|nr:hypothetical protein GGTG_02868 [Gaeumannomyces tritici R3-111a-1]EJT77763.1 hypothetical protein GGTG_02868 [Gaeumannomyces tritici R3-111a-1]
MATTVSKSIVIVDFKRSLVPVQWGESVRAVGMSECREAALSLAHAFAADDLHRYLVDAADDDPAGPPPPSPEGKWKLHVDIMTYIVAAHCCNGVVSTIGPDYEGVALWLTPGKNLDSWLITIRSGLWRLYFQLSPEGRRRYYDEMMPLLHHTKAEVLGDRDDDSYYLVYLGTKPSGRGRGYARKLLEEMIARADAEGRPMYLESTSLANVALYAKFGFEVRREIFLERGPVPVQLSIMVREPQQQPTRKPAYPARAGAGKLQGGATMKLA